MDTSTNRKKKASTAGPGDRPSSDDLAKQLLGSSPDNNTPTTTKPQQKEYSWQQLAGIQPTKHSKPQTSEKPTYDYGVTSLDEGIASGYAGLKAGATYATGEVADWLGFDDTADEWRKSARDIQAEAPQDDDSWGFFLGSLVPSTVPSAAAIAAAPFTGGGSLAAAASIGALSYSSAGSGMMEYEAYKKARGEEVDPLTKVLVGTAYGGFEAIAEKYSLGKLMPSGLGEKILLKGNLEAAEKVGADMLETFAKKYPSRAAAIGSKVAEGMSAEGLEEVTTEIGQAATQIMYQENDDRIKTLKSLPANALTAFMGGSIMGGALGPLSYGAQEVTNRKRRKAQGGVVIAEDAEDGEAYELVAGATVGEKKGFQAMDSEGEVHFIPETNIGRSVKLSVPQFDKLLQDKLDTQQFELSQREPIQIGTYKGKEVKIKGEDGEGGYYVEGPDGEDINVSADQVDDIQTISPEDQMQAEGKPLSGQPAVPVEALTPDEDNQEPIQDENGDFIMPGDEGYEQAVQAQNGTTTDDRGVTQENAERVITIGGDDNQQQIVMQSQPDGSFVVSETTKMQEGNPITSQVQGMTATKARSLADDIFEEFKARFADTEGGFDVKVQPSDPSDQFSPLQIRIVPQGQADIAGTEQNEQQPEKEQEADQQPADQLNRISRRHDYDFKTYIESRRQKREESIPDDFEYVYLSKNRPVGPGIVNNIKDEAGEVRIANSEQHRSGNYIYSKNPLSIDTMESFELTAIGSNNKKTQIRENIDDSKLPIGYKRSDNGLFHVIHKSSKPGHNYQVTTYSNNDNGGILSDNQFDSLDEIADELSGESNPTFMSRSELSSRVEDAARLEDERNQRIKQQQQQEEQNQQPEQEDQPRYTARQTDSGIEVTDNKKGKVVDRNIAEKDQAVGLFIADEYSNNDTLQDAVNQDPNIEEQVSKQGLPKSIIDFSENPVEVAAEIERRLEQKGDLKSEEGTLLKNNYWDLGVRIPWSDFGKFHDEKQADHYIKLQTRKDGMSAEMIGLDLERDEGVEIEPEDIVQSFLDYYENIRGKGKQTFKDELLQRLAEKFEKITGEPYRARLGQEVIENANISELGKGLNQEMKNLAGDYVDNEGNINYNEILANSSDEFLQWLYNEQEDTNEKRQPQQQQREQEQPQQRLEGEADNQQQGEDQEDAREGNQADKQQPRQGQQEDLDQPPSQQDQSLSEKEQQLKDELSELFDDFDDKAGGQLNAGIDPELITLSGKIIAKGAQLGYVKFKQFANFVISQKGGNFWKHIFPNFRAAYSAKVMMDGNPNDEDLNALSKSTADDYIDTNDQQPTEVDDESDSADNLEPDSPREEPENGLGQEDVQPPTGADQQPDRQGGAENEERPVPEEGDRGGTANTSDAAGEQGDSGVSVGPRGSGTDGSSSGRAGRGDSSPNNEQGPNADQQGGRSTDGAVDAIQESTNDRSLEERKKLQQKASDIPVKLGDASNVRQTLPVLFDQQKGDVAKAEERFYGENAGKGILFSNGTGTGKTYSGLGVIKRHFDAGKENILIVVPGDQKAKDWIDDGKNLDLDIYQLQDTEDAGEGIRITTYANFRDNRNLSDQVFDLVVYDESHNIMSNKGGELTSTAQAHFYASNVPSGALDRAKHQVVGREPEVPQRDDFDTERQFDRAKERWRDKFKEWQDEVEENIDEIEALSDEFVDITNVVFLSATPFAYHKNLKYADGILFDIEEGKKRTTPGYNQPDQYESFFIRNFGYRMRYNKLTEPEAEVNVGLMERAFHKRLRNQGVMSARSLDLDQDYSRDFVLESSELGQKIDEGIRQIRTNEKLAPLKKDFKKKMNWIRTNQLLESIKARESVERIQQHLAQGRKVVVFHNYKTQQPQHPFQFTRKRPSPTPDVSYDPAQAEAFNEALGYWNDNFSEYTNLDLSELTNPVSVMKEAFGDDKVGVFNGDIKNSDRKKHVEAFNADNDNQPILVVQTDAGKEGISMHDTTGEYPRVLINLGLPIKPTDAIQMEGRIYRIGQKTNAIFEYPVIKTNFEMNTYAQKIQKRVRTPENLALGEEARSLEQAFKRGYDTADYVEPSSEQGTGGKEADIGIGNMSEFDKSKTFFFAKQKKTRRNKSIEGKDYYATPEPLGLKMVEWLDHKAGDSLLEPSAGHGAIARFFPENTNNKMLEPSYQLFSELSINGVGEAINDDFESHHIVNKYDGIAMNPPYGNSGKQAMAHLEKATRHLKDGGRVVAIVPDGPSMDKRLNKWFESEDADNFYKTAEISLPTKTFERAATKVKTKIVVIDKYTGEDTSALPIEQTIDLSDLNSFDELFDKIENLDIAERPEVEAQENQQQEEQESIFEIVSGFHTREHYPIWTVIQNEYIDNKTGLFNSLKQAAKLNDGYYSSYNRGDAQRGFIFKSDENAESFKQLADKVLSEGIKPEDVEKNIQSGSDQNEAGEPETPYQQDKGTIYGQTKQYTQTRGADGEPVGFVSLVQEDKQSGQQGNLFEQTRDTTPTTPADNSLPDQLQPAQQVAEAKKGQPLPEEFYRVRREYTESHSWDFTTGSDKVRSISDVAHMMRSLETKSVEYAFAVATDSEGNATVLHISSGLEASTLVGNNGFIDLVSRTSPETVYFVHNHPSGNLTESGADIQTISRIKKALPGVQVHGIIMDTYKGEYAVFDEKETRTFSREQGGDQVAHKVYRFDKSVYANDVESTTISSPGEAASFLSGTRYSVGDKLTALVLDNAKNVNAAIQLTDLSTDGIIAELSKAMASFGGISVVLTGRSSNISAKDYTYINQNLTNGTLDDFIQVEGSGDNRSNYSSLRVDKGLASPKSIQQGAREPSFERKELVKQVGRAQKEYEAAQRAYDNKERKLRSTLEEDQENLFGQRQSDQNQSLFNDRADASQVKKTLEPFAQRLNRAKEKLNRLSKKLRQLEDRPEPTLFDQVEEQALPYDPTDSKAFKKWFGDSKVIDDSGDPLVVYHGTPDSRGLREGFKSNIERLLGQSDIDRAFFFSDSFSMADSYADDRRAYDYQRSTPETLPVYLSLKDPLVIDAKGEPWNKYEYSDGDLTATGTREITKLAKENGHDGIIINNVRDNYNGNKSTSPASVYVAFNPTQIKSSTENKGTYDPGNPDIRFKRNPDDLLSPTSSAHAQRLAHNLQERTSGWASSNNIVIADSKEQLPSDIQRILDSENDRIGGIYHNGTAYVFTFNLASQQEADAVIAHEAIGHGGIQGLLRHLSTNKTDFEQRLKRLTDEVYESFKDTKEFKDITSSYNLDMRRSDHRQEAAEEFIAAMAESNPDANIVEKFVKFINDVLRKLGLSNKITKADIKTLLADARQFAQYGTPTSVSPQGMAMRTAFKRTPLANIYYGRLTNTVAQDLNNKGTAQQFKRTLQAWNRKGKFKSEELQWSGVMEWLDSIEEGPVYKDDVLEYLASNQIQINETMLHQQDNDTKYNNYTLRGGEDYTELLFTLPGEVTQESYQDLNEQYNNLIEERDQLKAGTTEREQLTERIEEMADELKQQARAYQKGFKSSHYDTPNLLGHVRFNTRTDSEGNKVLFLEEIQSDWHQAGREKGYNTTPERKKRHDNLREKWITDTITDQEQREFDILTAEGQYSNNGVPDAPFKTTWHELIVKRMIRHAAEHGFDKVAWTTGQQQTARYDLSNHVNEIQIDRLWSDQYEINAFRDGKSAPVVSEIVNNEQEVKQLVGKDIAKEAFSRLDSGQEVAKIQGDDLQIGGKGMEGFYNKMIPRFVSSYTKKWGAEVAPTDINVDKYSGNPIEERFLLDQIYEYLEEIGFDFNLISSLHYDYRENAEEGEWFIEDVRKGSFTNSNTLEENGGDDYLDRVFDALENFNPEYDTTTEKVLAVNITPKMRRQVLDIGQPLFAKLGNTVVSLEEGMKAINQESLEGGSLIDIGNPSDALKEGGISDSPILLSDHVVRKAKDAGLSNEQIQQLPDQLNAPVMVFSNDAGSNQLVLAPIGSRGTLLELSGYGNNTVISNIYTEDSISDKVSELADDGHLTYINKTLAREWIDKAKTEGQLDEASAGNLLQKAESQQSAGTRFKRLEPLQDNPHDYQDKKDNLLRKYQDRFRDIKQIQKGIDEAEGTLTDETNFYTDENRSYGRIETQMEDFQQEHVTPFKQAAKKLYNQKGVTYEDIRRFLYARHAPERNAYFKAKNPDAPNADMQSGMPKNSRTVDGEMREGYTEIMEGFKQEGVYEDLQQLSKRIDKVTDFILDKQLESGLISDKRYNKLKDQYDYYVPLRGFSKFMNIDPTVFSGNEKAEGRQSEAGDILSYLFTMADTAIIQGEKNQVKQTMLEFVKKNWKRSDLFRIRNVYFRATGEGAEGGKAEFEPTFKKPTSQELVEGEAKRDIDIDSDTVKWSDTRYPFGKNSVHILVNGRPVVIEFSSPHIAEAINGTSVDKVPRLLSKVARYMGLLRNMITQYSPEFGPRNLVRDSSTGFINLSIDFDAKTAASIVNPVAIGKAFGSLRNALRNGEFDGEWGQTFKEFRDIGGMSGWWQLDDVSKRTRNLQKEIEDGGFSENPLHNTKNAFKALGQFMDDYNRVLENVVRLSAYKHLVENDTINKDTGNPYTKKQAADYAKNLTVNFNRKGNESGIVGSLYLFFNASVQGIARQAQPFFSDHTRTRWRAAAAPLVMASTAYLMIDMMRMALGRDDDGEYYYDKVNEWTRTHNILLPNLLSDKPEDFIKIPLPYGYNVYWAAGDAMNRMVTGSSKPEDAALQLAVASIDSYNPIGTASGETFGGAAYKTLLPTVLKPGQELYDNLDFAGRPIKPEPFPFTVEKPNSQQYFPWVGKWAKETSQYLNTLTGGDEVTSGFVDVSPEHLEYLVQYFGGGTGRFLTGITNTAENISQEISGTEDMTLYDVYDIPFARSAYGTVSSGADSDRFRKNRDKINKVTSRHEYYYSSGQLGKADNLYEANKELIRLEPEMKAVRKQVSSLYDWKDALESQKQTPETKKKIKQIDESINELYDKFNRKVNQIQGIAREPLTKQAIDKLIFN